MNAQITGYDVGRYKDVTGDRVPRQALVLVIVSVLVIESVSPSHVRF
jgi:hypothetical protein